MGRGFPEQAEVVLQPMMTSLFSLMIPAVIFSLYLYFLWWVNSGLKQVQRLIIPDPSGPLPPLSIILAAHNEQDHIGDTLTDLLKQADPPGDFEIIVVADRCTDQTPAIVTRLAAEHPSLVLLEINETPAGMPPKKFALQQGILMARFPFLVLMDADCRSGAEYLKTFQRYFGMGMQVVVNFAKPVPDDGMLFTYLLPERLMAWSIAAAAVGHRQPFLAFGTTWGYTRALFDEVGGFSPDFRSLSGDDDLLLSRMSALKPPVAACLLSTGWGKTRSPRSLLQFYRQRRRHHSAGKYYPFKVKLGYLLHHLSNLLLWILPMLIPLSIFFLILKWIADSLILRRSARIFRESVSLKQLVIFQVGYLLHHILIAPLSQVGRIRWR